MCSCQRKHCFKTVSVIGSASGSTLGAILFTIYLNGVVRHINGCRLARYADNIQFIHSHSIDDSNELIRRTEKKKTIKIKLWAYAEGVRGIGAHLRDIDP